MIYALAHDNAGVQLAARYAGADFTAADVPAVIALLDASGARAYTETHAHAAMADAYAALTAAGVASGPLVEILGDVSRQEELTKQPPQAAANSRGGW